MFHGLPLYQIDFASSVADVTAGSSGGIPRNHSSSIDNARRRNERITRLVEYHAGSTMIPPPPPSLILVAGIIVIGDPTCLHRFRSTIRFLEADYTSLLRSLPIALHLRHPATLEILLYSAIPPPPPFFLPSSCFFDAHRNRYIE